MPALGFLLGVDPAVLPHPVPHEVKLLGISKAAPVLGLYVTARDASGKRLFVLDIAMPGDRHELEDAYQVS